MKTLKYELLGFSGLLGVAILLLILPGGEENRQTMKTIADGMVATKEMFGER